MDQGQSIVQVPESIGEGGVSAAPLESMGTMHRSLKFKAELWLQQSASLGMKCRWEGYDPFPQDLRLHSASQMLLPLDQQCHCSHRNQAGC